MDPNDGVATHRFHDLAVRGPIAAAVRTRLPHLPAVEVNELTSRIHLANMVSSCQFCNATTSRDVAVMTMADVIASAPGDTCGEILASVAQQPEPIRQQKQAAVVWKLKAVEAAFANEIGPELSAVRKQQAHEHQSIPPTVPDSTSNPTSEVFREIDD